MEPTDRDLRTILSVQALRAGVYGFGSVILGSSLAAAGRSEVEVGLVFTAMLAGNGLAAFWVGLRGDRLGRRRLYRGFLLVMGAAGAVYAITTSVPALVLAALTGTLSTDPNESGPVTSLEQAMIGGAAAEARAGVFGRYNAVAYLAGAVGALMAGGPTALRELWALPADHRFLLAFPLVALACALLASRLSAGVEVGGPVRRPLQRSRSNVRKLAALFSLDSFAGGFVVTTFVVFWFQRRFGASPELMGLVVFCAGLLQAGSSIVAARLGARFGLLRTAVFTHIPSNALLALVPVMPTLGTAIAMLLARFALSQMDVPTRQAYLAALVDPEERTAAAAFTNTARYVSRPIAPSIGGALMQVSTGAPFLVAGTLKIGYDLLLWRTFRGVEPPEP